MTLRKSLRRLVYLALTAFLCSFGAAQLRAQTALGSIEGVVVDTDNTPVPGVNVYAVSGPAGTGRSHGALTNADGRFRIEQLVPGTYLLSAYKTEDGYADAAEAFYGSSDHPFRSVAVASATQQADISIQLGAKCGTLHVDVSDAISQKPITHGVLMMQQRNSSSAVQERDQTFPGDFLLPATDVSVSIHAPGYNDWKYSDDGRSYITLRPGEHRTIHAALQPSPAK